MSLTPFDRVVLGRGASRRLDTDRGVARLEIDDEWMSGQHAQVVRTDGGWMIEDLGSRNGTFVNEQRVERAAVANRDVIEVGGSFFRFRDDLDDAAHSVQPATALTPGLTTVVPWFEVELERALRVAASNVSIVLLGPSGAGKEVTARAIHDRSRRSGPFVAVNCGGLPANLVEAELFGHVRGAFTGAATDRLGLIGSADGGTLLLDEIGDLPRELQPALLRVLQERAYVPVGATRPVPVDFRLIVATHRDLPAQVFAGEFREDLWARVAGLTMRLPALTDRLEDLSTLIAHLVRTRAPDTTARLDLDAARAILRYRWPLNVRELEKALTLALALAGDVDIGCAHLPPEVSAAPRVRRGGDADAHADTTDDEGRDRDDGDSADFGADDPRREQLAAALAQYQGNVSAVARALGKPRSQIG